MKTRIITAIVLLIVILPCVIWGGLPFKALIGIVAGIAVFEMLSICNRPKAHIYLYPIVAIFVFYSLYFEKSALLSKENTFVSGLYLNIGKYPDSVAFFSSSMLFPIPCFIPWAMHGA